MTHEYNYDGRVFIECLNKTVGLYYARDPQDTDKLVTLLIDDDGAALTDQNSFIAIAFQERGWPSDEQLKYLFSRQILKERIMPLVRADYRQQKKHACTFVSFEMKPTFITRFGNWQDAEVGRVNIDTFMEEQIQEYYPEEMNWKYKSWQDPNNAAQQLYTQLQEHGCTTLDNRVVHNLDTPEHVVFPTLGVTVQQYIVYAHNMAVVPGITAAVDVSTGMVICLFKEQTSEDVSEFIKDYKESTSISVLPMTEILQRCLYKNLLCLQRNVAAALLRKYLPIEYDPPRRLDYARRGHLKSMANGLLRLQSYVPSMSVKKYVELLLSK